MGVLPLLRDWAVSGSARCPATELTGAPQGWFPTNRPHCCALERSSVQQAVVVVEDPMHARARMGPVRGLNPFGAARGISCVR
jgi:hypothetical protein